MGATNDFNNASWGVYGDLQEDLEKQFVAPRQIKNRCVTLQQDGLGRVFKKKNFQVINSNLRIRYDIV